MSTQVDYWHAFSGIADEVMGEHYEEGLHALAVIGPSFVTPEDAPGVTPPISGFTYVASWDHEPTDDEKEAVTPEEYRD